MKYWLSLVNTVEVDQFVDIGREAEKKGHEDRALWETKVRSMERFKSMMQGFGLWGPA